MGWKRRLPGFLINLTIVILFQAGCAAYMWNHRICIFEKKHFLGEWCIEKRHGHEFLARLYFDENGGWYISARTGDGRYTNRGRYTESNNRIVARGEKGEVVFEASSPDCNHLTIHFKTDNAIIKAETVQIDGPCHYYK